MAAIHERLEYSLQNASNDIERNKSSSPTLPTINDIHCESGIRVTTTILRLSAAVSGHTSKGLAEAQQ